jgi:uncharacterized membrane protein YfhO
MQSPAWDPKNLAVVDRPLPAPFPATTLVESSTIKVKEPDKVVVHTTTNRSALLVLSDVYAHGWKAWVDDKPAPILITNVAFRGVVVPAGEHDVRFEFDPDALVTGRWISGILFALLILYTVGYVIMRRRRTPSEEPATA